jgi:hypothetical protein
MATKNSKAHPGKALPKGSSTKNTCFSLLLKKVTKVESHLGKKAKTGMREMNTCFSLTHQKLDALAKSVKALKK